MPNGAGNLHKTLEMDAKVRAGATNTGLAIVPFLPDSTTYACSIAYNLQGPSAHVVKACATGLAAIGQGYWDIATGRAKLVVAGATEAPILRFGIVGFDSLGALSRRNDDPTHACRPFDRDRDGFVISEGAAALVLEDWEHARARGARIYAEVLGWCTNMDARDWTRPNRERQVAAVRGALADAGLRPEEVEYVNAHATATRDGDVIEAETIRTAFPDHWRRLPVSATKSVFGHTMAAAGAIAAVVTAFTVSTGLAHPTHNLERVGEGCELRHIVGRPERINPRVAVVLAFGFGGQNAVLVLGRPAD
jgi:3-oxoacyl-[acyl-carrier-protein] synthase II